MVKKKSCVWSKDYMKNTLQHTRTPGTIYNMSIEGRLRNDITRLLVNGDFEKCRINGEISNMKYHRLNRGSAGQKENKFEIIENSRAKQVTIILPFTKLDVMVKFKTENGSFTSNKSEKIHCYIKPKMCIVIAQNTHSYIPENTAEIDRRWIDIKITLSDTQTEVVLLDL